MELTNKKNILKKNTIEIYCEGKGESENLAVENAFKDMRIKIVGKIKHPIITILTKEIYLIEKEENSKQEAFMYFFAKRMIKEIKIKLKLIVDITYLEI